MKFFSVIQRSGEQVEYIWKGEKGLGRFRTLLRIAVPMTKEDLV